MTTNSSIWVYQRTTKLSYEEKCHIKYENTVPASIKVNEESITFDHISLQWKYAESKDVTLTP